MRKTHFIMLCIILAFSLCSCRESSADAAISKDNPTSSYFTGTAHLVTHIDGMMGNSTAATDSGYYYFLRCENGDSLITYIDYANKSNIILCNRPECLHNDASCTAWVSPEDSASGVGLFTANGKLYMQSLSTYAQGDSDSNGRTKIWTMDANGANRTLLHEFAANESIWGGFVADETSIYFLLDAATESGNDVNVTRTLTKLSLTHDTLTPIAEFSLNTYLFGACADGFIMKDITYPEDFLSEADENEIYLYNPISNSTESLTHWTKGRSAIVRVYNGTLYVISSESVQAINPVTHKTDIVQTSLPFTADDELYPQGIFDNHFMFFVNYVTKDGNPVVFYNIDLSNGVISENSLKYTLGDSVSPVFVRAESSYGLLVISGEARKNVTYHDMNGVPYEQGVDFIMYSLANKDDFWNNIMNFDAIADYVN